MKFESSHEFTNKDHLFLFLFHIPICVNLNQNNFFINSNFKF